MKRQEIPERIYALSCRNVVVNANVNHGLAREDISYVQMLESAVEHLVCINESLTDRLVDQAMHKKPEMLVTQEEYDLISKVFGGLAHG